MSLLNVFVGVPQSKYAAMAILAAAAVVSLAILFGKDPIPLSQKFAFVLLILLMALPGLLLSLFQLTCLVTGAGIRNQRWWCSGYAWILSVLLIIYSIFLVATAVITLATGEKVMVDVERQAVETFEQNMATLNQQAKDAMEAAMKAMAATPVNSPPSVGAKEGFEGNDIQDELPPLPEVPETETFYQSTPGSNPAPPSAEPFVVNGNASVPAPFGGKKEEFTSFSLL